MHEQIGIKVENKSDQVKHVEVWNNAYSDPDVVISFRDRNKKGTVEKIDRKVEYSMLNILSKSAVKKSDYEDILAQLDFRIVAVVPDGVITSLPLTFKHNANQQQSSHVFNEVKFELDTYCKLTFNIPAKTTLLFDLFSIIKPAEQQQTSNQ